MERGLFDPRPLRIDTNTPAPKATAAPIAIGAGKWPFTNSIAKSVKPLTKSEPTSGHKTLWRLFMGSAYRYEQFHPLLGLNKSWNVTYRR